MEATMETMVTPKKSAAKRKVTDYFSSPSPAKKQNTGSDDPTTPPEAVDEAREQPSRPTAQSSPYRLAITNPDDPRFREVIHSPTRVGLCESQTHFRAHQGGTYTHGGQAFGLLIDAGCRPQDLITENTLIAPMGGSKVSAGKGKNAKMIRIAHMKAGAPPVKGMITAYEKKTPVLVIIGNEHPDVKSKKIHFSDRHAYAVAGWFQVTYWWVERDFTNKIPGQAVDDYVKVYCVKLQKIGNTPSWWHIENPSADAILAAAAESAAADATPAVRLPANRATCRTCRKESIQIYQEEWFCLNADCKQFQPNEVKQLTYSRDFIDENTATTVPDKPLLVPLPTANFTAFEGESVEGQRMGLVCPNCYCCSPRREFAGWRCDECGFFHKIKSADITEEQILEEEATLKEELEAKSGIDPENPEKWREILKVDGITTWTRMIGDQRVVTYFLPNHRTGNGIVGSVTVIYSNDRTRKMPNGANDIFAKFQAGEVSLGRGSLSARGQKGEKMVSHYVMNYGVPYKYGVFIIAKLMSEAPDCVMLTNAMLQWAGKTAIDQFVDATNEQQLVLDPDYKDELQEQLIPTNETLVLGYNEKDFIGLHDDGESELGPTVETMSFGSPSIMTFTTKPTKDVNRKNGTEKRVPQLKLVLEHGDIVIMQGTAVHKLYLHGVTPHGSRRFAVTGRTVYPHMKKDEHDREYARNANKDAEASINRFVFDGQTFTAGQTWDPKKEPKTPERKEVVTPTKNFAIFDKTPSKSA